MIILTFAHQGEAAEFIRRQHTLPVDFYFPGLYRSHDELLLITGEGAPHAADRLSRVCSYFGDRIRGVLNLGIAGGLHPDLELNQIYGIRYVLHEFDKDRYTCASRRADRTCITALQAVADEMYRAKLRERGADCVDMEIWGQAAICHELALPFQSYKLISDQAGRAAADAGKIIRQAPVFSKHLFDFYKKLDHAFLVQ